MYFGNQLPPPELAHMFAPIGKVEKPEEFENGWKVNAVSFLKMALEPGSIWTTKAPGGNGYTLIVRKLLPETKEILCDVEGHDLEITQTVKNLIQHYNPPSLHFEYRGEIEYGANCKKCNKQFQYQKKSSGFVCWACQNGY